MAIDRAKELERIADKLGIGKNRDVECVGCQTTFQFKDAVIMNEGEESKYLCKTCYGKVINGKLKESNDELLEQLIKLEKYRRQDTIGQGISTDPNEPPIQWQPVIWESKMNSYDVTYTTRDDTNSNFVALIPNDSFSNTNKV